MFSQWSSMINRIDCVLQVNVIDLVATLTFYVDLLLTTFGATSELEFFSIIRIMRLFKLTQHSSGLKILMHTFRYANKLFRILQPHLIAVSRVARDKIECPFNSCWTTLCTFYVHRFKYLKYIYISLHSLW